MDQEIFILSKQKERKDVDQFGVLGLGNKNGKKILGNGVSREIEGEKG